MTTKKLSRSLKPTKAVAVPSVHYTIMIALAIGNITSLGLAFLMAQLLGVSMGNIAIIGATQGITIAHAQVISNVAKQERLNPTLPAPTPAPSCDARWSICSQACEDQYTAKLLTPGGWNRCERDCDLRLLNCNATGQWMEEIKVRDTKFKT